MNSVNFDHLSNNIARILSNDGPAFNTRSKAKLHLGPAANTRGKTALQGSRITAPQSVPKQIEKKRAVSSHASHPLFDMPDLLNIVFNYMPNNKDGNIDVMQEIFKYKKLSETEQIGALKGNSEYAKYLLKSCDYHPERLSTSDKTILEGIAPSIKELDLLNESLNDEQVKNVATTFENLEQLCFYDKITDAGVTSIATLKKLKKLKLEFNINITDADIAILVKGCPKLQELELGSAMNLTDTGLASIATLTELTKLCLPYNFNITDAGVATLVKGCPKLQMLELEAHHLTNTSIEHISTCKELKKLAFESNIRLGDVAIDTLTRGCPKLQELKLALSEDFTDTGLASIATLTELINLSLSYSPNRITDACIATLAQGCSKLQQLELSSWNLTDKSLVSIATLKDLKKLIFASDSITNTGITILAKGCPKLEKLILNSSSMTDTSLTTIAAECNELITLDVCKCQNITRAHAIHLMKSNFPKIHFLYFDTAFDDLSPDEKNEVSLERQKNKLPPAYVGTLDGYDSDSDSDID